MWMENVCRTAYVLVSQLRISPFRLQLYTHLEGSEEGVSEVGCKMAKMCAEALAIALTNGHYAS